MVIKKVVVASISIVIAIALFCGVMGWNLWLEGRYAETGYEDINLLVGSEQVEVVERVARDYHEGDLVRVVPFTGGGLAVFTDGVVAVNPVTEDPLWSFIVPGRQMDIEQTPVDRIPQVSPGTMAQTLVLRYSGSLIHRLVEVSPETGEVIGNQWSVVRDPWRNNVDAVSPVGWINVSEREVQSTVLEWQPGSEYIEDWATRIPEECESISSDDVVALSNVVAVGMVCSEVEGDVVRLMGLHVNNGDVVWVRKWDGDQVPELRRVNPYTIPDIGMDQPAWDVARNEIDGAYSLINERNGEEYDLEDRLRGSWHDYITPPQEKGSESAPGTIILGGHRVFSQGMTVPMFYELVDRGIVDYDPEEDSEFASRYRDCGECLIQTIHDSSVAIASVNAQMKEKMENL
ncbi:hypothetical protein RIF23_18545 [Lipingzhangella sp. LS1_29]|uniref:Uncharacterized protein n=1 Tax=Lipingzhangella rawalii TaxID=2055835 RepID=A0ABU2HAJ0_9ACTN|nr:hypothetical protein [Lipingzhangella rawalii]MDS1272293.1 hypothetical protein [Lipingzhangella rawalii]